MKVIFLRWAVDIFFVTLLLVAGYTLIGFYVGPEYLSTGYQDWIYHAFRVKSLVASGLRSWDPIWSNGINHWWGYPFFAHYVVVGIMQLLALSIPKSMLFATVVVFLYLRVLMYL